MINAVTTSLPHLLDREAIKKTLEECHGRIDDAVSKLLDAEERGSISSQQGSSSTERDPDSNDDEFNGPNKKQDRRMSRATKAVRKENEQRARERAASQTSLTVEPDLKATTAEPTSTSIELPVRSHDEPKVKSATRKIKNEDDDDWVTPSDDDADDDFRPDPEEPDNDAASEYSGTSRSQSRGVGSTPPRSQPKVILQTCKTMRKQQGPQRKRITARDRIEMKKAAQKQARKDSKRNGIQASRQLIASSINVKRNSPPMDQVIGIKTLYI